MKENEEMQITIEVLSHFHNDTNGIALELTRELGESAKVELIDNKTPMIQTRGPDPGLALQLVSVAFAGIGVLIKLAALLKDISKKKNGGTLIITNPKTGKAVKLSTADSLKRIEKKLRKILKKKGVEMTFKKN